MNNQDYENKKRECWEEFIGNDGFHTETMRQCFNYAFDRAYALGKQEKDAEKANDTLKARRKSDGEIIEIKEWRGASDVVYSSLDMNQFYQASDLDFNLDAEKENVNLSQSSSNCDKEFDNILRDSFSKERRMNMATRILSGMLSNQEMLSNLVCGETTTEGVVKCIVNATMMYTDALITECEKGGPDGED